MGVKRMTELIKRFAPEAVKPFQMETYKGKALAIDGNLLMQRFHHGSTDKPVQLLWYRFLKNLREHDITPICVFDGAVRHPAKKNELLKRQAARALAYDRAHIEVQRSNRLLELQSLLNQYRGSVAPTAPSSPSPIPHALALPVDPAQQVSTEQLFGPQETLAPIAEEKLPSSSTTKPESALETLVEGISQLSMQSEDPDLQATPTPNQKRLADLETEVFQRIKNAEGSETALTEISDRLEQLQTSSHNLANNYTFRSAPIPKQNYDKVMRLIRAMGIPCMETPEDAPTEAEATASSLVHYGIAEAVISEDSDVLLYDVPMIRHVTGFKIPASVIDGKEVRQMMGFSREQFVDLAILSGTDFCETTPKLGPLTAHKLLLQYPSIEEIMEHETKYAYPEDYLLQVQLARQVFLEPSEPPVDFDTFKLRDEAEDFVSVMKDLEIESELYNNVPINLFGQPVGAT